MATRKTRWIVGGVTVLALAGGLGAAIAQERGMGGMGGWGGMMGGGPGMGRMMGARFCNAKEPMAPRLADRLETTLKVTDAQKGDFDNLRKALADAEGKLKAACPTEAELADRTPPGRLALAEKRMSAGLDAIRTIRPAVDTLYAKLDDKQKDRLRWMGPGRMHDGHGMGGWWRHGSWGGRDGEGPGRRG
ncbi:hypothetical protein SLNSH_24115 [Alsobacter soli]|uniref:LTXXQ motif family protein n=1 Tax=Alsobacter soli TaxID=2109933 RepID=A0A2T1HLC8_9HYPH|nr:Spy/CpxP family protein refolding chaperone [Alsobacter soli]PSC02442.1 hypothetical protein SLNSH_24115 [Alsobacter soli]